MLHTRAEQTHTAKVQQIMTTLGFDQMTAERHLKQRRALQERLRAQSQQQVKESIAALRPRLGR